MEEFYNIFGAELKAVTGEPKKIDAVIQRVEALTEPISSCVYDPFEPRHEKHWKELVTLFDQEVLQLESQAIQFIDESFKTLRSAEGAFDMLLKFRHIRSRKAINQRMMHKFNEILTQYCKEVEAIDKLFENNKEHPPIEKNHPPIAGAIYWEKNLFHRIKHVMIRLRTAEDLMATEEGEFAKNKYLFTAKKMKAYETELYENWKSDVEKKLHKHLNSKILIKLPEEEALNQRIQYIVNFNSELSEIINETKYLEQLGFNIPEYARNVALQEDKYKTYVDGLNITLKKYHHLLDGFGVVKSKQTRFNHFFSKFCRNRNSCKTADITHFIQ